MPGRACLAFWQPERFKATRAGVLAGACSDCGLALRYSAGPRVARTLAALKHGLRVNPKRRDTGWHERLRTWHGGPPKGTACTKALWHAERHGGEPTANGRAAQVTVRALPIVQAIPMQKTCTIFSWRLEAVEACSVHERTTPLLAPGCSLQGSNVRHEQRRKGREAAFETSALWRG